MSCLILFVVASNSTDAQAGNKSQNRPSKRKRSVSGGGGGVLRFPSLSLVTRHLSLSSPPDTRHSTPDTLAALTAHHAQHTAYPASPHPHTLACVFRVRCGSNRKGKLTSASNDPALESA